MKALRTALLALLSAMLIISAGWPAATTATKTPKTVKGYRTKTGKVVKPYARKAPAAPAAPAKPSVPAKGKATAKGQAAKAGQVAQPKAAAKKAPAVSRKPTTPPSEGKVVHVKGYTTKTGKVVKPYTRRAPTKKQ